MTTDAQSISYRPAIVHQDDIVQGDTCTFRVTLNDENDDPINLTGTTADMEIKRLDGTLVLALGIGNGTIIEGWKAVDDGAISISAPFQEGRYLHAVGALVKRGVVYFSLLGASANKVRGLVVDVEKKLAAALEGGQ